MGKDSLLVALEDPTLKRLQSIRHAFFTRDGGVSEGRYTSLNCAYASQDDPAKVCENRNRAISHLECSLESLVTVKNIHSNKVVVVDQHWSKHVMHEADAMVTNQKEVILGSDSADCPIVLFADELAGVIGLAHAGWRGVKNGVLESTVLQMTNLGAAPSNIVAVIGPCITQVSYEVSDDFYQQFVSDDVDNHCHFLNAEKSNHFMFDLPGYVENSLSRLSLKSIRQTGIDTDSDERFFSCRRSYHHGDDDFGGHLSCIYMQHLRDQWSHK